MQLRRKSRMNSEVSTSSLSDIMFFLMLFFLIISTLVNPSVIKLMLPKSEAGKAVAKQTITVSVDAEKNYFINNAPVTYEQLEPQLSAQTQSMEDPTVVLRADNTLTVQTIVDLITLGNKLKIKMVLATTNK
ncbi:MAG TPA: biopolymer transporter ExbD [Chitinophagales bacterium]|nr:biopolymer transporter ExbD [Chitinophagales bacterium]